MITIHCLTVNPMDKKEGIYKMVYFDEIFTFLSFLLDTTSFLYCDSLIHVLLTEC